ncbi:MAG: VOC family protein [Solirubrobacterales bacterium]|nr:VOC family protein [Solirubrobacterales bacterium]
MPRLRQAVIAVGDLDRSVELLRSGLGLNEPFADPAVGYFGLENAVFAIGDTCLELVSPTRDGTAAGRLLERRGGDCGYMAMLQVPDLAAARERAHAAGVREVFAVELDDIEEVHLHPGDMRGAIVALSVPKPTASWRWGGEGWAERSVPGRVAGITVAATDPAATRHRWETVAGGPLRACEFEANANAPGIAAVEVEVGGSRHTIEPGRL